MNSSNMALYMQDRRARRREKLLDMRGNRCEKCGSSEDLEFNHIDRSTKSFGLSGKALDTAWSKILEELNKCELLCRPCHVEYTRGQYESEEILSWNKGRRQDTREDVELVHGTAKMYTNENCRCTDCKYAKKLYRQKLIDFTSVVSILR